MKVVTPAPEKFRIAIEFDRTEAEALLRVCSVVSGCPTTSRRRVFEELRRILANAGVEDLGQILASGDIHFKA
jgi:hypothetical protein